MKRIGRPARYDWSALFKRKRFTLIRGRDYDCSQSSIVAQIRSEASKRDVTPTRTLHIEDTDEGVTVTLEDSEQETLRREVVEYAQDEYRTLPGGRR